MRIQAVLSVILVLTGISAVCLPTGAEPTLTPHEDPAATQSTMDATSFLAEYAAIFSFMSNQLYENASRLSEQLGHITVPEVLSYIINRYNNLTQQLINVLNDLQGALDSVSGLLDQNRLSEAEQALEQASVLVAKAQILLGDLKDATATVSQRLGVFSGTAQSSTQQAYNQLQNMLEKLSQLVERYHELLNKANQRVEETKAENLGYATLTLSLNGTSCYVGSTISAVGTLTSQGEPLGNREISLYIDGAQAAETSTDTNGNYQTTIAIPYKYISSITIQAIYSPTGSDRDEYLAALSPTIALKLLFYLTNLEISSPDVAYPGLALVVTGKATDSNGQILKDRQVAVALDGTIETQVKTNRDGTFTARFTINTQTTLGKHTLEVTVYAHNLYAPTSEQKTITVQKMVTDLQVNAPTFIVLPAQLEITGKVSSSSSPLKGATVQVEYANISRTTKTRDDGSFNVTIEVPLNTALAGGQELEVQVKPSEPWQTTAETNRNIFALNSISTSIALASTVSIFTVAYMRLAKSRKAEKILLESTSTITIASSVTDKNKPVTALPSVDKAGINDSRSKILQLYVEALIAAQTYTSTPLTQSMTLREYAQTIQLKIGAFAKEFTALTGLAEKSLYSPHKPQPSEIQQAKEHSEVIRRNLNANT